MLLNTAYGQMVAGLLLLSCVKLASEAGVQEQVWYLSTRYTGC